MGKVLHKVFKTVVKYISQELTPLGESGSEVSHFIPLPSLDKLKLRIVVRGYLQNKELVGDTWSPTASMGTLKYFLEDATKKNKKLID